MKLRPLHGWRAFAGEVGIIVIGVLIALGAQQIVESIHDRREVDQLRSALRAELADDRARWEHMRASDSCTLQRLDASLDVEQKHQPEDEHENPEYQRDNPRPLDPFRQVINAARITGHSGGHINSLHQQLIPWLIVAPVITDVEVERLVSAISW